MTKVVVVTNTELGWDNVVGVFSMDILEEIEARFPSKPYMITIYPVGNDLDDFE